MTTPEPTQLLLLSKNANLADGIKTTLADVEDFTLAEISGGAEETNSLIVTLQPEILLLDSQFIEGDLFSEIDALSTRFPTIPVVALLPEGDVNLSNQVILAGARAFLFYPLSSSDLLATLKRVKELLVRSGKTADQPAVVPTAGKKMFVVFSPKGGVGVTTTAINLAISLRQQIKDDVLLVDGKHLLGHVSLMLNLRIGNSITDLLPHSGRLDPTLVKQVITQHSSGIHVLPGPIAISKAQGIRPDDLYRVILGLQSVYSTIIVDGGNYLNENLVTYMDAADHILLVINPNLPALRDARQFLDISHTLSYSREKILVLLNQSGRKSDVKLAEIEQALRTKVFGVIPTDEDAVLNSINEGVPLILKKSNHPISKAYAKIARVIADTLLPVGSKAPSGSASFVDILRKSSRLG